ncbi:histone deacetylase complex protein [Gymnopilus junonius]|uniref:histone deacetylase n=1 Tax=Gymnopilus junonius TaxID=109634 RepID=A0A9P5TEQ0_GYMJU|nr:histone deacetylase complex protein [Gymnopilus junonius]
MDPENIPRKAVVYIGSQELAKISSLLPSNRKRSMIVHSLIKSLGLMDADSSGKRRLQVVTPRKATYRDLAVYHTRDYLDFVLNSSKSDSAETDGGFSINAEFGLEDDCPPFPGLAQYVQIVGGATLTAVSALQQDLTDIAMCWDGGRHHARKSQASGFCYVADCILAILAFKRNLPRVPSQSTDAAIPISVQKPRIMYLDLDLHFSDAVSEAFYSPKSLSPTPQILTLSIHHAAPGFFPPSERSQLPDVCSPDFDPFTLSIPLRQGASNTTYSTIWPIVEQVKNTFKPDYIVIQCGVDALAGDPCSTFNWSLGEEEGSLGWCIERILAQWTGKKLLLGGGGYNSPNAARAWSYLTSIALESPLSLATEIPDHAGFPLYAPSFTLDVPAGNMSDHNTQEYLTSIKSCFDKVLVALHSRLNP